jgi:hypothetical protein
MRAVTIEAKSFESARDIHNALSQFYPDLIGSAEEGYQVSVELRGADRQVVDILDVLVAYVTGRDDGPARIELHGKRYNLHAEPQD